MKKAVFVVGFLCNYSLLIGQTQHNPINILRYNDDFNSVKSDSAKEGFNKLKHIPLGSKANISFGGELREQYQYFRNLNFGDVPPATVKSSVGQLWHRVMMHSNIEIGKKLRVFVQMNSTFRFFNPNPVTPEIDENRLSLHQAFIDYNFHKNWMLRIGRQEMGYGNNRLLTFREGPNTRLTFDAAILKYKTAKRKIDFLAVTPVLSKQFAFDDVSFKDYVWGVYGTEYVIPKKLSVDYYFLNFTSNGRRYNFVPGKENRQSFGVRLFSQNKGFNYELESTYQTGSFNDLNIAAYGLSADINYKLNSKLNFITGVSANYISGDKNNTDNKLNTYNLLFSKPSYGLAAPIGSSNIININPYLRINPLKKLSVYTGVYFMQRQINRDGTYSPGMAQVRPSPANLFESAEKNIGTQYAIETTYELNQHFSFAADAAFFKAGNYVKETGKGLDISYFAFKAAFKF
ncbi:alginate export family protein [Lacibacter sp. H407]|uniref:alginate export family protein n=1 Tax=Lacibacter sp. H407 TaxID=3133423 RepID=UPI0030C00529